MNQQIARVFESAEGRYLSKAEQGVLRDSVKDLDARLRAMEEIQSREQDIVERVMKLLMQAYPDFENKHQEGQSKGTRDISLVLRYASSAMVRNDPQWFETVLLRWFNTILRGIGFTSNFVADTYKALDRVVAEILSPPSAALLRPFVAQATDILSTGLTVS
ncbi:MAG: hypothetical protein H7Z43_12875 [Clostridia bacterium]|nr:hypothetical protein [Deltaproteobacteria bacterium]